MLVTSGLVGALRATSCLVAVVADLVGYEVVVQLAGLRRRLELRRHVLRELVLAGRPPGHVLLPPGIIQQAFGQLPHVPAYANFHVTELGTSDTR